MQLHWLIPGSAFAAATWTVAMTNMEKSSTAIKNSAETVEEIARDQVNQGKLNRVQELMSANKTLNEQITHAKSSLEELERASQK